MTKPSASDPADAAAPQALAPARSGLLITHAEWDAMVSEDPQADPFWPESWLGRIDPLAGRRSELGSVPAPAAADHRLPPPPGKVS